MDVLKKDSASWTVADLLSSYRFWGLLAYFVLIFLACNSVFYTVVFQFIEYKELSVDIGTVLSLHSLASCVGLLPAWIVVRSKNTYPLYIYGGLALAGVALISFAINEMYFLAGTFLLAFIGGAVSIAVPAIIVGTSGRAETFVVAFGVMTAFSFLAESVMGPLTFADIREFMSSSTVFWAMGAPIMIGMLLLVPVDKGLFYAPPPQRANATAGQTALTPKTRDSVAVFLLCLLVPFYLLYWLYRIHGEARTLGDSSSLLSAKASAWLFFFVPLLFPLMMAMVNDHINAKSLAALGGKPRPTWVIVIWSLFCGPVAAGLIQADMNKAMALAREQPV